MDIAEIAALVALAIFLLHSTFSGKLAFFLAPIFHPLPPLAAILLLAMAAARALAPAAPATCCGR